MPATYEPIATTTLSSTASDITFSSIPGTYTDLRIVCSIVGAASSTLLMQYNSDTGSNYSITYMYGNGSSAGSSRTTSASRIDMQNSGYSTTVPNLLTIDIFSYAGSTYKTCLTNSSADANGSGSVTLVCGLWRSTSAITSIKLYGGNASSLASGTKFTLYGILKA